MELYLVRHGQTIGNINSVCQGSTEGELTELGYAQSKLLGIKLSKINFQSIYCSNLNRARQTLKQILSCNEGKNDENINYLSLLQEKNMGCFEGVYFKLINKFLKKKAPEKPRLFRPINGESSFDVMIRATKFLNNLIETYVQPTFGKIQDLYYERLKDKLSNEEIGIREKKNIQRILFIKSAIESEKEAKQDLTEDQESFIEKVSKKKVELKSQEVDEVSIEEEIKKLEFENNFTTPYFGYDPADKITRLLIVSHGGFLNELINITKIRKGIQPSIEKDLKNASLTILRVSCEKHGGYCEDDTGTCKIVYDYITYNEVEHLKYLNK